MSSDPPGANLGGVNLIIQKKDHKSVHDRKSLIGVRDNYQVLADLISQIGVKLSDVANVQEKEFLNAYRVHMLNVQLELKELKNKVEKAEESLQDDGEVSKLEDECNWFRAETNRLLVNKATMMKDIKRMRSRLDSLLDQQTYLRDQLKTVMKKTRILEAEIEFNGGRSLSNMSGQEAVDTQLPQSPIPITETKLPDINKRHDRDDKKKKKRMTLSKSKNDGVVDNFVAKPSRSPTQKGQVITMRKLMSSQSSNKSITMTPEEQLELLKMSRSSYELELEDLIKRQFTEIVQRRSETVASSSKSRINVQLSKTREGIEHLADQMIREVPREIEGMTGLGVEHFTDTDRYNTIVDFLSNYPVFCEVVKTAARFEDDQR